MFSRENPLKIIVLQENIAKGFNSFIKKIETLRLDSVEELEELLYGLSSMDYSQILEDTNFVVSFLGKNYVSFKSESLNVSKVATSPCVQENVLRLKAHAINANMVLLYVINDAESQGVIRITQENIVKALDVINPNALAVELII